MYDLHIHSLLSDGVLLPSEIARRYEEKGYKIIAITDHCDYSNIKSNTAAILEFCKHWPGNSPIKVLPGIELTHMPLEQFQPLAKYARKQGIKIIVGHGESPVEPVARGTNRQALLSDINILAHPGNITKDDCLLAKEKGIFLELTARKGHCQGNTHLVKMAKDAKAHLVINNDAHTPEDIIGTDALRQVGVNAGLSEAEINQVYTYIGRFLEKLI